MKTVAFFNNKGGVGKTSLVYHLAHMFADHGIKTIAVDLDPQANLTAMFLNEERLENLWAGDAHPESIYGAIRPILDGEGDINPAYIETINPYLGLLPGDLGLSKFEDRLSEAWPKCHNNDKAAFRTMTAFHRLIQSGAKMGAELALIDVGPNLGAINRAALIAADQVCLPLAPDLFSLQGMKNLGPTVREWRNIWNELLKKAPAGLPMPNGSIQPIGYIVMQHGMFDSRPVQAYKRWMDRIPAVYREVVLQEPFQTVPAVADDPNCLSLLKHYRSLMPMAMENRKPIFFLKARDGAIGAHSQAVTDCYDDFKKLASKIASHADIAFPPNSDQIPLKSGLNDMGPLQADLF